MTRLLLLGACVAFAGACATTTPSTTGLRDTDGNPLPIYALDDTDQPPLQIHCADGNDYHVAVDRDGYLYSPGHRVTYHVTQPGSDQTLCNRILGYRRY